MNIAIFADIHGRILLCFKLCARWERETGEKIDLVLQAGDLGAYPDITRLDRATINHARSDPSELGFANDFVKWHEGVAKELAQTTFPLIFVRGNHEDHAWLDSLEKQSNEAIFPIDAYRRIFCLKTGIPYRFQKADDAITILGIGRIGAAIGTRNPYEPKYIQAYEQEELYRPGKLACDLLLTHDIALDSVKVNQGMEEIRLVLDAAKPVYHFHGHTEEPFTVRHDSNGVTEVIKMADLHWDKSKGLEADAMGILRWQNREQQRFEMIEADWLHEYHARSWRSIR
ncbi:MAG: serine/threonine protein phosphatase [Chloroflexi bacterium]|nr:serine/threonine protein phosphatase [Chloroflexota bacterium]